MALTQSVRISDSADLTRAVLLPSCRLHGGEVPLRHVLLPHRAVAMAYAESCEVAAAGMERDRDGAFALLRSRIKRVAGPADSREIIFQVLAANFLTLLSNSGRSENIQCRSTSPARFGPRLSTSERYSPQVAK